MIRKADPIKTNKLCYYGCGNVAKYVNGSGNLMCDTRSNKCPEIKKKNSSGGKQAYSLGIRTPAKERYKNLDQEIKDKMSWNKGKNPGTIFKYGYGGNHKAVLIKERGHKCESCGLEEWLDQPITLELEHIDGDNQNNVKNNLKLLCPNCHSFTDTWKGRNSVKKKEKIYVRDDELIESISNSKNIRQALLKVGLTPKGANYERAYDLIHGGVVKLANTSDLSSDASA